MLRFITSHKLFFSVVFVSVVLVAGSVIYYAHVTRTVDRQLGETEQFRKHTETDEPTASPDSLQTDAVEDATGLDTDLDTTAPENVSEPAEAETLSGIDSFSADAALPPEDTPENTELSVSPYGSSPYGFGSYPEVPIGFPENLMPVWTWSEERQHAQAGGLKDFELMARVLIKLWNRGDRDFIGVNRNDQNGRVYPIYQDVMYVTSWVEREEKGVRLPSSFFGFSQEDIHIVDIMQSERLPEGVLFLDADTNGYDPYQFLDLH